MSAINNISYKLDCGNGVEFTFTYKGEGFRSAYLQLPNTPDSIHHVDGEGFNSDDEYHNEVFDTLRDYFYDYFKDIECAKASAFTGEHIIHVENVAYDFEWFDEDDNKRVSQREIYVAFSENNAHVFYFDKEMDLSSEQEQEVIAIATKSFFSTLKSALKYALESGTDAQCDDIVNAFMNENFWMHWCQNESYSIAMDFYENIACDCRFDREHEIQDQDEQ